MPVPVLILISFVALVLYMVVGGVVSVVTFRVFTGTGGGSWLWQLADPDDERWFAFWSLLVFWPAMFAILAVAAVFVGPVWLTKKAAHYAVKAQVEH
jgi:hypothetical protein